MDRTFPLGFPFPTAFYLTLYVLTLVVHVVFMNYVLAGTGYLAVVGVWRWFKRRGGGEPTADEVFEILRDWMPFMLSAAITAGVAPLLFVQVLYKENFYTANLLLFHRWMAILPVLIVGFYLLYLMKSKWMEHRSAGWLAWVTVGALACFVFTGYTWTENHLLSLDRASWSSHYGSGAMKYRHPLLVPRFLMWAAGSIATMALIVGWQMLRGAKGKKSHAEARSPQRIKRNGAAVDVRKLANLAICGIILSGVVDGVYGWLVQHESGHSGAAPVCLTEPIAKPYAVLVVVGLLLQLGGWLDQRRRDRFSIVSLGLASIGLLATLLGMTVVREAIRLDSIDITKLYEQHAKAARVGGWWVFVFFLVVNAVLIAWCVRLARQGNPVGDSPASE